MSVGAVVSFFFFVLFVYNLPVQFELIVYLNSEQRYTATSRKSRARYFAPQKNAVHVRYPSVPPATCFHQLLSSTCSRLASVSIGEKDESVVLISTIFTTFRSDFGKKRGLHFNECFLLNNYANSIILQFIR